jgi:beta-galactosidase
MNMKKTQINMTTWMVSAMMTGSLVATSCTHSASGIWSTNVSSAGTAPTASGASGERPRQTLSLDQDWRFHKGSLPLPGRVPVTGWHYRMEPKGEAAAVENTEKMTSGGLETTGAEWKAGTRFEYAKDVVGEEWMEGGNLRPKGEPLFAWFRAQIPGVPAAKPALEFEQVEGLAFVYVNGVKLARHEGRRKSFVVDIRSIWKSEGINTIAMMIEAKGYGGLYSEPHFVDLAAPVPSTSQLSPAYDDRDWLRVDVPHDYVVEGPVTTSGADGYKRDYGWYRKGFVAPVSSSGSRVWLEFDGVYRMSRYWLNGQEIGIHPSGYAHARFDVTDVLKSGENTLVVSVDPTLQEGWWYDGGGIYRHVRLMVAPDVHVAPDGVFVRSTIPDCKEGVTAPATLNVGLTINNFRQEAVSADIENEVLDAARKVVLANKTKQELAAGENNSKWVLQMPAAKLWSCEHPELYSLRTTVSLDGKVVDVVSTSFGVRKIEFHAERGFLLNDRPVKIKGTANHQNHAGVGSAIPERLHVWRLEQLKKMGSNAIRYCYQLDPIVYETCDRLGILVMGEFRQFGDTYEGKVSKKTSTDGLRDQIQQVKRDRNHPCIILWCLGNEEGAVSEYSIGARMTTAIKTMVDAHDGTRLTTKAVVSGYAPEGICGAVDVVGMNYHATYFDRVRASFPSKPFIGTEACSEVATRGFYDRTIFKNKMGGPDLHGDVKRGYLSSYSENGPGWWQSCEVNWKAVAERPWMAGTFIWTGFDYKGEPTPFGQPDQPSISSSFGILDSCGFPKDSYYYYKSWWTSEPVIHVFPHWNWPGKEGREIPVWVHSNADEVELFLNGKSLGKKKMERNSHLEWNVPYAPGKLEAKGLSKGKEISDAVETTGEAAALALVPDRTALAADGADLAWVAVSVVDAQGRIVPTAGNRVRFSVSGPGNILGVGNGDSSCYEPDKASQRSAFNGLCMVLVQTSRQTGDIVLTAESDGLKTVSAVLKSE